uniref:glutathione transferase n=1 Tax=Phallusia mammillata TaxID=59560 RepID=A0A6F9DE50_9ASCI|nr:hematopoietic prostaglandin D synthase-like [Phallusia mammillata]
MPNYKLYYFPLKGRGEVIRLLFHYAGVEFEDIRVSFKDWPSMKNDMPYKQMPVLEVDGVKLSQSAAIGRYVARELGLMGKTSLEGAKADEIGEAVHDVMMKLPWTETNEEEKKKLMQTALNEGIPPMLKLLETRLDGDYFLSQASSADIVFAGCADYLQSLKSDILDDTPRLAALKDRIFSNPGVAKYVAGRPKTDM